MRHLALGAVLLLVLAGCQSAPTATLADDPALERFAEHGYAAAGDNQTIDSLREHWRFDDSAVDVVWQLPHNGDALPLVIYLPGLGESVDSGSQWRSTWAKGGYAVVSMQLEDVAQAWSSPLARQGRFTDLAKQFLSDDEVTRHARAVQQLLDRLANAQRQRKPPFDRIDMRRLALAGFDLGGQTSLSIAGDARPASTQQPAAVMALSPLQGRDGGADSAHPLDTPLLLVDLTTGDIPYAMPSGSQRAGAASHSDARFTDLTRLTLQGGSRRNLDGDPIVERPSDDSAQPDAPPRPPPPGSNGGPRGDDDQRLPLSADQATLRLRRSVTPRDLRQRIVVQQTSLAFLDATVRSDKAARDWLHNSASEWMGDLAQLQPTP